MKKIFYILPLLLFVASTAICQNFGNANKDTQINPPDNIPVNDIPNQQMVMNNPPQMVYPQQAAIPQQAQVQIQSEAQVQNQERGQGENIFQNVFASDNGNQAKASVNVGSSNHSARTYSSFSSSSKSHSKKSKINLHKVHILRKFRNECPLLKAKTYQNIFSSKKHKVRHCSVF